MRISTTNKLIFLLLAVWLSFNEIAIASDTCERHFMLGSPAFRELCGQLKSQQNTAEQQSSSVEQNIRKKGWFNTTNTENSPSTFLCTVKDDTCRQSVLRTMPLSYYALNTDFLIGEFRSDDIWEGRLHYLNKRSSINPARIHPAVHEAGTKFIRKECSMYTPALRMECEQAYSSVMDILNMRLTTDLISQGECRQLESTDNYVD